MILGPLGHGPSTLKLRHSAAGELRLALDSFLVKACKIGPLILSNVPPCRNKIKRKHFVPTYKKKKITLAVFITVFYLSVAVT